jgi:hypothetical protein
MFHGWPVLWKSAAAAVDFRHRAAGNRSLGGLIKRWRFLIPIRQTLALQWQGGKCHAKIESIPSPAGLWRGKFLE